MQEVSDINTSPFLDTDELNIGTQGVQELFFVT